LFKNLIAGDKIFMVSYLKIQKLMFLNRRKLNLKMIFQAFRFIITVQFLQKVEKPRYVAKTNMDNLESKELKPSKSYS